LSIAILNLLDKANIKATVCSATVIEAYTGQLATNIPLFSQLKISMLSVPVVRVIISFAFFNSSTTVELTLDLA